MPKFCQYHVTVKSPGHGIPADEAGRLSRSVIDLFERNYCSPSMPAGGPAPCILDCVTDLSEDVERIEFRIRNDGEVERMPHIFEAVRDWAESNPDYVISIHETNADLPSDQRFATVSGGMTLTDNKARIVPANMVWDPVTVEAIIKHLSETRHDDAADTIRKAFGSDV